MAACRLAFAWSAQLCSSERIVWSLLMLIVCVSESQKVGKVMRASAYSEPPTPGKV